MTLDRADTEITTTRFRAGPVVEIGDGQIRGVTNEAVNWWRGVPFAAPPMGPLRWRAPRPPRPWRGVRDASDFGNAPQQFPRVAAAYGWRGFQPVDEDCLTLNIAAPARPGDAPLPVMVFFYGGGNFIGTSANYRGDRLAERGVIFVSVNYRLGALGYLDLSQFSTEKRTFDNNLGLRDQAAALRWVRDNIAAFGGDPGNVTIFGESAGAVAVTTLMATPSAEGLFHRAIAQSSVPMMPSPSIDAQRWSREFVDLLGISGADVAGQLDQISARKLTRVGMRLLGNVVQKRPGDFPFGPTIDGDFLPADPIEAIAAGKGAQVPLMIGTMRSEATLFTQVPGMRTDAGVVDQMLGDASDAAVRQLTDAYRQYPRGRYPTRKGCTRIVGHRLFWAPSTRLAAAHSWHAPSYMYRFDYAPPALRAIGYGPTHASDLLAVFGLYRDRFGRSILTPGDWRAAERVTEEVQSAWVAFAGTGVPADDWPGYEAVNRSTRIIDRRSYVIDDPDALQRRAWEQYFDAAD